MSQNSLSSTLVSQYQERLNQIIQKRKQIENKIQNGPSDFVKHLVKNLNLEEVVKSSTQKVYSNDMTDACKTVCKICHKNVTLNIMRTHTRTVHKINIKDYRDMHGNPREQIINKVYHKCQLCKKELLLDADDIHIHVLKHQISLREYNHKFILRSKTNINRQMKYKHFNQEEGFHTIPEIGDLFDTI